jgi:hypothetical protein
VILFNFHNGHKHLQQFLLAERGRISDDADEYIGTVVSVSCLDGMISASDEHRHPRPATNIGTDADLYFLSRGGHAHGPLDLSRLRICEA